MSDEKTGLYKKWLGVSLDDETSVKKSYAQFQAENTLVIIDGIEQPSGSFVGILTDAYSLRDKVIT